jgi:hypothetical protein
VTATTDLGLGDLVLVALFSPVERNAPGLNDGFDEVLAGADLLEATLRGEFRDNRRAALRSIRAHANGRCEAGIERLESLGLAHREGSVDFLVRLPGSKPRGLARVPPLVFNDPDFGESLRHEIARVVRAAGPEDGRLLCLALLIDAGPWMASRAAPGTSNADVRAMVKRIRRGKETPSALTTFVEGLGVDGSVVLTVIDATRVAVKSSRSAW